MKKHLRNWQCVTIIIAFIGALSLPVVVGATPDKPKVVPPNANVVGMTYGDLTAAWWQWALSFSNSDSPIVGDTCVEQPDGPIFFLAGAASADPLTRYCDVPAGKTLVFPILNSECSTVEIGTIWYGKNEVDLRTCVSKFVDGVDLKSLRVLIDGVHVAHLRNYRIQSPPFSFTGLPDNNYLGVPSGTSGLSVSDGYWIIVEPLSVGSHTIHFEGAVTSGPMPFSQDVTYELTITE